MVNDILVSILIQDLPTIPKEDVTKDDTNHDEDKTKDKTNNRK